MELNSVGSLNAYSEISGTGYSRQAPENDAPPPFPGNGEDMDISRPGKMMSAVSKMSEDEKSEIKAFQDEVMKAIGDGTFDASELADDAPESMVKFAEENGLDLEQMIAGMAQRPQGPPPMMYGADGKGIPFKDDNEGELLASLLQSDETDAVTQSL